MPSNEDSAQPSKGLGFAVTTLVVMLLEFLIVIDLDPEYRSETVVLLFKIFGVLVVLQIVGIILVMSGHYRVGGILQIVASVVHILDGFGVLGVIGGMNAIRYAKVGLTDPPAGKDDE